MIILLQRFLNGIMLICNPVGPSTSKHHCESESAVQAEPRRKDSSTANKLDSSMPSETRAQAANLDSVNDFPVAL